MGIINLLTPNISDKIAAGEVVESPASAIKELIENSIDAGSDVITVEFEKNGTPFIRITDNGKGMAKDDAALCFLRHATSKIKTEEDLSGISTLGFRGEAMSSIGAVSRVELYTKRKEDKSGTYVLFEGGKLLEQKETGCTDGTTIVIKNLFFNTPARMKFLKRDATEAGYIADTVSRFILSHPEISFKLTKDGEDVFQTPGDNDLQNAIYSVYGRKSAMGVTHIDYELDGVKVSGIIGSADSSRSDRRRQSFFINGRYIKNRAISKALEEAYKTEVMTGKFPISVINIELNPHNVDVNVHPTKLEVKFSDESLMYRAVYHAVKNAFSKEKRVPEMSGFEAFEPQILPKEAFGWDKGETPTQKGGFSQYEKKSVPFKRETYIPTKDLLTPSQFKKVRLAAEQESFSEPEYKADTNSFLKDLPLSEKEEPLYVKQPEAPSFSGNSGISGKRIIGQLFDTYILIEDGENIVFIDQHAAHERLKFEELKEDLKNRPITPQYLAIPIALDLTESEKAVLEENKQAFLTLGFEFSYKDGEYSLSAVPSPENEDKIISAFSELLEAFDSNRQEIIDSAKQRLIYTIACKAAIKANHSLSLIEMEALVKRIYSLKNINTCPHGRPIMISMSKTKIEKEFGRIV